MNFSPKNLLTEKELTGDCWSEIVPGGWGFLNAFIKLNYNIFVYKVGAIHSLSLNAPLFFFGISKYREQIVQLYMKKQCRATCRNTAS